MKKITSLIVVAAIMIQVCFVAFAEEYIWQTVSQFDFGTDSAKISTIGKTSENSTVDTDEGMCIKNSGAESPVNGVVINNLIPEQKRIGESYKISVNLFIGLINNGDYTGNSEIRIGLMSGENISLSEIRTLPVRSWQTIDFTYTVSEETESSDKFFIDRGGENLNLNYPHWFYIKSATISKSCTKDEARLIAENLGDQYQAFSFDGFEDTGENVKQQLNRDGITYIIHRGNSALKTYNMTSYMDKSTNVVPAEGYSYMEAWTNDNDGGYVFSHLLPNLTSEDIGRKIKVSMYVYIRQMQSGTGKHVGFKICLANEEETEMDSVKTYGEARKWVKMEAEFEVTEKNLSYSKIILMFDNYSEYPMWSRVDAVSVSVMGYGDRQNEDIKLVVDGNEVATEHPFKIVDDRLMMPAADLFYALGGGYNLSEDGRSIKATFNQITADISADDPVINRSGYKMFGQDRAKMIDDVLYIPFNTLKVAFKGKAYWNGNTQTISVDTSIKEVRRNIPKSTLTKTKDLNDLYFDEQEKVDKIPWDQVPEGNVILDYDDLFKGVLVGAGTYGSMKIVPVEGQPFEKALKVECTEVPLEPYHFQIEMPPAKKAPKIGDVVVVEMSLKTDSVMHEDANGLVRIAYMSSRYSRFCNEEVMSSKDKSDNGGWTFIRVAGVVTEANSKRTTFEFGFRKQVVEIGGVRVRNIGQSIPVEKLDTQNFKLDAINAIYDKDAQWRKDALERIEKYRKGDINVVVVDKKGNPIKDAEVDLSMYEHEFQWGNAFTASDSLQQKPFEESAHLQTMTSLFNTGVAVGSNKRYGYEVEGRFNARREKDALAEIGIKNYRGHAVYFGFQNDELKNGYKNEELMRKNLWTYFDAVYNDYGDYMDWDVMNECVTWTPLRDFYGAELYKEWFEYAREKLPPGAVLNYNETNFGEDFFKLLNEMEDIDVDYDSVGFQSHFRFQSVESIYNSLFKPVIEKGKRIRITEFDINEEDPVLAAGFIRDYLILCFSIPNVDAFISWGYMDVGHWLNNGPYYYNDNKIKPGGEQYIDLVYNKWWTKENGKTNDDGIYTTRGYYGDYDITVTKGGATIKTTAKISKYNEDNTIVVTFK